MSASDPRSPSLLELEGLRVDLRSRRQGGESRTVIRNVSLVVDAGETVGVVGESGSGKSMTARTIMRLLPKGADVAGEVHFEGRSVLALDPVQLTDFRAHEISMIYQDPRSHINPLHTIGDFLTEGVVASGAMRREEARLKACGLLRDVGIDDPDRRLRQYPHQLSGGLLQRVMIVAALLPGPKLVLADEPTTALDVTIQAEVMAILADEIRERSLGLLFITHDLDLAAAITDTIAVMYAGVIVEHGPADRTCEDPLHPYTAGLLASRPSTTNVRRLVTIPGRPQSAYEVGAGCVFAARCAFAIDRCRAERPMPRVLDGQQVACHRAEELRGRLSDGLSA